MDVAGQQAVVAQRLDPGSALLEAVDDGLFAIADGGDGGTGGDDDASFHRQQGQGLLGATLLNLFQVIEDIVDRPDFHGLFLLLPGQGEAEDEFNFTEQFNGIDTVKAVIIAEIIIQVSVP